MSGKKSSAKGSTFERKVCKELSLAYTNGTNDNVFWRTAGSGARGTFRRKTGADCYNIGGDIGFLDPIGKELLDRFYFELKCGYKSWDVLNWMLGVKQKDLSVTIEKLKAEAGHKSPVLILKQDHQEPVVLVIDKCASWNQAYLHGSLQIRRVIPPYHACLLTLDNFYERIRGEYAK